MAEVGMFSVRCGLFLAACAPFFAQPAHAEEIVPLAGCYERVYDAAWLKGRPGQIVRRVTLFVAKTSVPQAPEDKQPILADATLAMHVGATAFSTLAACYWEKIGLVCNAALSAEETSLCKSKEDGVRDCRVSMTDAGSFGLAQKPEGLMLTVRERLEMLGPMDRSSFLYLSPDNVQNRAFLLAPAPEAVCKPPRK
ncbi:MAG: hypothetical protein CTY15_07835 [Methylocystis sp.]|nr:MAG: hypothetical protein CTY15_07835 [Methylocystis sp.]